MPQPHDTHRETESEKIERYRRMSGAEKWEEVARLNFARDQREIARIKATYGPYITEHEVKLRLASLLIPHANTLIKRHPGG
jgi:hypothetical protein